MKTTIFKSIVKKGNNKGVGFISIPLEKRRFFSIDEQIRIIVNSKIEFFSRVKFYGTTGFYVPYKIMVQNILLGKEVNVDVKKIDGFFTSIGNDGRIYIPQNIAEKFSLESDDIIEIKFKVKNEEIIKYCLVHLRERKNTKEYMCMFNFKKPKQEGIFKLVRKLPKNLQNLNFPKNVLKNFNFAEINNETIISYYGRRTPIIINSNIDIDKIAYYLGCYFADGTKRGNDWGICASTFNQGNFYIMNHKSIIKDSKIIPSISYTDIDNKQKEFLRNKLISRWKDLVNIQVEEKRVRIHNSNKGYSFNINPFGSLVLKEHRQLTQLYYNELLNYLLNKIKKENNKKLAIDFLCGVMEGDGSVSARKRGHIMITSNAKELDIIEQIVKITNLNYKRYMEGKNKGYIRFWALDIIKNIEIFKDKLFKYYPKRRKILKERLAQTGCARFLLGKSKKTSNWLIGQLNNYGILDGKGNLTKFGKKIQKDLKEFLFSKD
jgi:bifunctional DNA-binding transcriptional regulator/antitoxin component of YhaV-PrlF toxin-antitoxin module